MKLVENWRIVLRDAWSARLSLLTAVLGAAEIGVQLMAPQWGGWGALAAVVTSLLATLARIVQQAKLHKSQGGQQ
jgi:hypothetical protein